MALLDRQEPWKRDDVLVSAFSVEWVAKNVFLVAIPSYRRKVSCELTAVDVPRGTAPAITEQMKAVLARVNRAMRLYLRQDFYSNFPLEGYGDVIFSAETKQDTTCQLHWCSLQEALLQAGVACVVRPSVVRQGAVLAVEDDEISRLSGGEGENEAGRGTSWLQALQQREHSSLCCVSCRCVVEDVMRGDVYRVAWLPSTISPDTTDNHKSNNDLVTDLPPLLILDSTVCHSVSTKQGFAAMRWAQLHLLHRELSVQVHAVYPSDKDVAFNTQLETFEYLANVRGSASILLNDDDGSAEDIGVTLVTRGLAWVRRVADAGVPRASNLFDVFRAIEREAAAALPAVFSSSTTGKSKRADVAPNTNPVVCARLGKLWGLPASTAADLLRFHDAWWQRACCAALLELCGPQLQDQAGSTTAAAATGATAEVWKRYMWCGDLHQDPSDEPRVYTHRPLRTLFPLAGLAEWCVRLQGYVDGAVVLKTDDNRQFLQVEMLASMPVTEWQELRRYCGYVGISAVRFSPTPSDAMLSNKVKVAITAASFGSDVELRMRVCCASYQASNFTLAQHTPSGAWSIKAGGHCVEELSVDKSTTEERVFVLDVVVEGRDETAVMWTARGTGRAVYLLSPVVDSDAVEGTDKDGDDRDVAAAAAGPEAVKRIENRAVLQPTEYYQTSMSFFFELDASVVEAPSGADGSTKESLLLELKRTFADLMYEDVIALPVGVVEVCGVRGLIGDLLFPSEPAPRVRTNAVKRGSSVLRDRAPLLFERSLLSSIGRHWWPSAPYSPVPFASPHLSTLATPWPMSTTVCDAVQRGFNACLEKVEWEEWAARQSFFKEVEWHYQILDQEALNAFITYHPLTPWRAGEIVPPEQSAPRCCLHFTAGNAPLWRDSDESTSEKDQRRRLVLPPSILPPTAPLSLFAVRPRELFSVASSNKMKTTQRDDADPPKTLREVSYDQQDWAIMRLRFPFLPNILHCNWERLPLSLRNTERALCERIVRDDSFVREPGMLYSTDHVFSLFLSYLALLQSMQASGEDGEGAADSSSSALAAVYQALRCGTPSIWNDCMAAMHFSATLFVLPPFRAAAVKSRKHSRPLFLGSRDNVVTDAFEVPRRDNASPEIVTLPLLRDLTSHCVAAMAVESLVTEEGEEAEEIVQDGHPSSRFTTTRATVVNLDEGRRPDQQRTISTQGLPWRLAQATTPVLYHPLPCLAVLASPLVERDEYSADALGRLQLDHDIFAGVKTEPQDAAMVRRKVVLQYVCFSKYDEKSPYKTISYGRVSSVDMFKVLLNNRARGQEVQAYMSLLLRQSGCTSTSASDGGAGTTFPDGLLVLHGLPAEPLYLHYRSRADLRFTLSTICPPLRQLLLEAEKASTESPAKAAALVEKGEIALLTLYAEAAAASVRKIYERVRMEQKSGDVVQQILLGFTLQPWDDATPPYVAIQIFPVYPTDAELTERVLDQERIWFDTTAYQNNPHKAFSLLGTRFGRLPMAELRIHYDTADKQFISTWNEMFERSVHPGAPSALVEPCVFES